MPELPEVETVCRGLNERLGLVKNKPVTVTEVKVFTKKLREPLCKTQLKKVIGLKVTEISRRGKYLLFVVGKEILVNHLGMTGIWRIEEKFAKRKHDHMYFKLKLGRKQLYLIYYDPRKFGLLEYVGSLKNLENYKRISHLGPEPLEKEFSSKYLLEKILAKNGAVKNVIMDQKIVVGVGNIYACEALYTSGVRPDAVAKSVKKEKVVILVKEIKKILRLAIKKGGSTISDFKSAGGESGYFQHNFKVYGREGELCNKCHDKIKKIILGGRSSFFCSNCQQ